MIQHKLYGILVRCNWTGLYEWGTGWVGDYHKWREYWSGKRPKYYRFNAIVPPPMSGSAISLYSDSCEGVKACIYLYPQGFHTIITGTDRKEVDAAVKHLEILCTEAANECGAKVDFRTVESERDCLIFNEY